MGRVRTGRPVGRPPYQEPITPAESRVLGLVREGRTNAEIAGALGISVATVKTHVSSMLAKLELADRDALSRWDPAVEESRRRGRFAWLTGAIAGLRGVLQSGPERVAAAGASLLLAGVTVGAVLLLVRERSSADAIEPSSTPAQQSVVATTGSPTPTATQTATSTSDDLAETHLTVGLHPLVLTDMVQPPIPLSHDRPQSLIYDVQTGALTVAVDGVPGKDESGVKWRPGTSTAAVPFDRQLAFFDASAGTWQITGEPAFADGMWSANGQVFVSYGRDLGIIDIRAMQVTVIDGYHVPVAVSPNGRWLLTYEPFAANGARGRGAGLIDLTDPAKLMRLPDEWLSFISDAVGWLDAERLVGFFGDNRELRVVDLSSGRPITIAARADAWGALLSPDRQLLAVVDNFSNVTVMKADSLKTVSSFPASLLAWAPDSSHLLVSKGAKKDETLEVVTLDGKRLFRLARSPSPMSDWVAWSPDGSRIAFSDGRKVWTRDGDGVAPATVIAEDPPRQFFGGTWSDDSRFVSFTSSINYSRD